MSTRKSRTLITLCAATVTIAAYLWIRGEAYLEGVGSYLAADAGTPAADVIMVRSYGYPFLHDFRTAVKLFREKKGVFILAVIHEPLDYQKVVGNEIQEQSSVIVNFFERSGVPSDCYSIIQMETRDPVLIQDAVALRTLLKRLLTQRSWHRVMLIGRGYRMRRVLWTFGTFIPDETIQFVPYSRSLSESWNPHWWANNDDTSEVISEYMKLIYFRVYNFRSDLASLHPTEARVIVGNIK